MKQISWEVQGRRHQRQRQGGAGVRSVGETMQSLGGPTRRWGGVGALRWPWWRDIGVDAGPQVGRRHQGCGGVTRWGEGRGASYLSE
jgi:hypothetical protein